MNDLSSRPWDRLRRSLPEALLRALSEISEDDMEEIHITGGRSLWVRAKGKMRQLAYVVSPEEPEQIVLTACAGSRYAVEEMLREGFFTMGDGIRVGVAGKVTLRAGKISELQRVESLCIRFPQKRECDVSFLRPLLDSFDWCRGILVYAPPGGGKTTLLREAAFRLSCGAQAKRVVVVDPRREFAYALKAPGLCIDVLEGYPMARGLQIALRVLGAQAVICDEISPGDVDSLLALHGGGVPLLASVHGSILSDVLALTGVSRLHQNHVFGAYVRPGHDAPHQVTLWEEI